MASVTLGDIERVFDSFTLDPFPFRYSLDKSVNHMAGVSGEMTITLRVRVPMLDPVSHLPTRPGSDMVFGSEFKFNEMLLTMNDPIPFIVGKLQDMVRQIMVEIAENALQFGDRNVGVKRPMQGVAADLIIEDDPLFKDAGVDLSIEETDEIINGPVLSPDEMSDLRKDMAETGKLLGVK